MSPPPPLHAVCNSPPVVSVHDRELLGQQNIYLVENVYGFDRNLSTLGKSTLFFERAIMLGVWVAGLLPLAAFCRGAAKRTEKEDGDTRKYA